MAHKTHIEVRNILPHRYPFLLVDKVTSLESGKLIVAQKNVTANEPFFQGHFPGNPVMPGVLMLEALAQAAGILAIETLKMDAHQELFYLAGVDHARFKRLVVPGDILELTVEVAQSRSRIWKFNANAHVDGHLACSAVLTVVRDGNVH